jgi:hypothetical protein
MYTICNGCRHVLSRPRLDDYDIDKWRGECAKIHKIWAHKNAYGGVGLFPVGQAPCPDIEGGAGKVILCTDCKWAPPPLTARLPVTKSLSCAQSHQLISALDYFCDVPLTSLIRKGFDFCSDYDNGNHPTRFDRILSDIL